MNPGNQAPGAPAAAAVGTGAFNPSTIQAIIPPQPPSVETCRHGVHIQFSQNLQVGGLPTEAHS